MNDITAEIKRTVAANVLDFAQWLFPAGSRKGRKWHIGDLSGAPGESLTVELEGEFAGGFRDWATDERGDCIELVRCVCGVEFGGALRVLGERYGGLTALQPRLPENRCISRVTASPERNHRETMDRPDVPRLHQGGRADVLRLSSMRNLSPAALDIARDRGLLWFYHSSEGHAWLITDRARRNAQARRLDGQVWKWSGKKAWTLGGSCGGWPIGLPESEPYPAIALCEGCPDFLAAFHHAAVSGVEERFAPVCMVGATMTILPECLPCFAGKQVRVFVHDDDEGLAAAHRWADQLRLVAAHVDGFTVSELKQMDGSPVKDLCDLASIDVDSWEAHRDAIEGCMDFAQEGRDK